MDAVKTFLHKNDKVGSTEVCSETGPAVTQENVTGHVHQEDAMAVDRERHIHHHQHRVQPVADLVHEKEKHETQIQPEITRETVSEMEPEKAHLLDGLKHQHKDTRSMGETIQTGESVGSTVNEHTHHHVHEHITPVIQRETHTHKVVHNVIPTHEVVHEAPIVHESTVLPTIQLKDFKDKLTGASHHHGADSHEHKFFEGQPKGANAPATQGVLGSHEGAATIDSKTQSAGHHSSAAEAAERV